MKKIIVLIVLLFFINMANASNLTINNGLISYFKSIGVGISKNYKTENICLNIIKKLNTSNKVKGCFKNSKKNNYFYIYFGSELSDIVNKKLTDGVLLNTKDKNSLDVLINQINNKKNTLTNVEFKNYISKIKQKITNLKTEYDKYIYITLKLEYLESNIDKINLVNTENKIYNYIKPTTQNTNNNSTTISNKITAIDCKYSNYDNKTQELYINIFNECIDDNNYKKILNNKSYEFEDLGKILACSEAGLNSENATIWRNKNNIDCSIKSREKVNYTYNWVKVDGENCKLLCKRNDGLTALNSECSLNKNNLCNDSTSTNNQNNNINNYNLAFSKETGGTHYSYSNSVSNRYISKISEIKPQILKYTQYLQDFVSIKIEYGELYNNILTNKKTTLKVFKSMDYDNNKKEWLTVPKELVLKIDNYNGEEFKIYNSLLEKNSDKQYKLGVGRYSIELVDNEIYDNFTKDYLSSSNNNSIYFTFSQERSKTGKNITLKNISIDGENFVFEYCNNGTVNLSDNEYGRSWTDIYLYIGDYSDHIFNKSTLKSGSCEKLTYKISKYELATDVNLENNKLYVVTGVLDLDDNEYDNILTKSLIIK